MVLVDRYYTATQVENLLRKAPQGLGRRLFDECRSAAAAAGFRTLTLVATLPGEPLYQALGFRVTERFQLRLPTN